MKKTILLFALPLLCACGGNTPSASSTAPVASSSESASSSEVESSSEVQPSTSSSVMTTVTDMVGRAVNVLPGSYQRVVCIGAGALRLYSYVGDMSLLCGVEDIDNSSLSSRPKMFDGVARPYFIANEERLKVLPSCGVGGPNAQAAEAEKILSCNPDIVVSEYEDVDKANALSEQLGVPVITLSIGSDAVFDEKAKSSLALLGKVFGQDARADALNSFIASEKEEIQSRVKDVTEEDKPSVYICGLGNWGTTNHLMTSQNYAPFNVANIKNVVTGLATPKVGKIEEEKFVALGETMDVMIFDAAAVKNTKPLYQENPNMFDTCKAWQTGEVYLQMAYNAYYTNLETSLVNTWYNAKVVYPELFADVDIQEKTDEITQMFNGVALAEKIYAYPHSYGGYQKIDVKTFFQE